MPVGRHQVFERHRLERAGQCQHALGRLGPGLGVEARPRHGLDRDTHAPGQLLNAIELRRGVLVLGQHDALHGPAADREQLEHGPPPLDLVATELTARPRTPVRPLAAAVPAAVVPATAAATGPAATATTPWRRSPGAPRPAT